jgi:hypothetical protein
LGTRSWRCGGGEEGSEEGGQVQGRDAPRVDCGSCYKHQRNLFDISVTHVLGGVAPGVVNRLGEPGQGLRIVSRWTPNDDIILTSGYAKGLGNAHIEVWGRLGRQRGGGKPRGATKLVAVARTALQASA